jgi:hypothetical protein
MKKLPGLVDVHLHSAAPHLGGNLLQLLGSQQGVVICVVNHFGAVLDRIEITDVLAPVMARGQQTRRSVILLSADKRGGGRNNEGKKRKKQQKEEKEEKVPSIGFRLTRK